MKTRALLASSFFLISLSFNALKAQTVFVTETGKKYHVKNCSLLNGSKKSLSLQEARKKGYDACKACKADEIIALEDRKKKPDTAK